MKTYLNSQKSIINSSLSHEEKKKKQLPCGLEPKNVTNDSIGSTNISDISVSSCSLDRIASSLQGSKRVRRKGQSDRKIPRKSHTALYMFKRIMRPIVSFKFTKFILKIYVLY